MSVTTSKMEMKSTIQSKDTPAGKGLPFLAIFALLCGCCLFADGLPLIDSDIESKWFCALFFIFVIGLVFPFRMCSSTVSVRFMDLAVSILFSWVIVRSIGHVTTQYYLRLAAVGVLYVVFRLSDILFNRATVIILAALTVSLALFGLGQLLHVFSNGGSSFSVVGTFDNPAGYASSLVMGMPFVLSFLKDERRGIRMAAAVSSLLVLIVLIATESRAALLAALAVLLLRIVPSFRQVTTFWNVAGPALLLAVALTGLYYLKKDSADGRLLIWWITLRLILQHPVLGVGTHAFWREYMPAQADFFRLHPDSRFALLADNVRHPFNEYLSVLLQWGVVGFVLLVAIMLLAIHAWRSHRDRDSDMFFQTLLALGIVACFSYPMNYPFAWIILVGCLARLGHDTPAVKVNSLHQSVLTLTFVLVSASLLVVSAFQYHYYTEWHSVAHHRPAAKMVDLSEKYERLLPHMKRDSYFLYNYSAELYRHKWYQEASEMMNKAYNYRIDYDMLHLYGDLQRDQQLLSDARDSYTTLSQMCPSRYVPLYRLFCIAIEEENVAEARRLANMLLTKPIKVASPEVDFIRKKVQFYNNHDY